MNVNFWAVKLEMEGQTNLKMPAKAPGRIQFSIEILLNRANLS